jgi:hypothetical protein
MLAIREFRRLKQKANIVVTYPIQDSRVNLLEEGGNDTIQLCNTTQVRSDLDFNVKFLSFNFTLLNITPNPTVGSSWNFTRRF